MGTIKERKAKGKVAFHAEVRHRGYPNLYRTFERRTDAKICIQDVETGMRSGRYLPQAEAQRHTLTRNAKSYGSNRPLESGKHDTQVFTALN